MKKRVIAISMIIVAVFFVMLDAKVKSEDNKPYLYYINLGDISSDFQDKIKYYSKAIEKDPDDYRGYYKRGKAYFDAKKYKEAIYDLRKALHILNSKMQEIYSITSSIYKRQGDTYKAAAELNKSSELGLWSANEMEEESGMLKSDIEGVLKSTSTNSTNKLPSSK